MLIYEPLQVPFLNQVHDLEFHSVTVSVGGLWLYNCVKERQTLQKMSKYKILKCFTIQLLRFLATNLLFWQQVLPFAYNYYMSL